MHSSYEFFLGSLNNGQKAPNGFTHVWIHAPGGEEQGYILWASSRLLLDSEEDAGEQVHAHHGNHQQPPDLEHGRPKVQHDVVLERPVKRQGRNSKLAG